MWRRSLAALPVGVQDRMILLSPDAVEDVERLQSFLDQYNPDAARRCSRDRKIQTSS
jgi:hypothetical protein